ncbi:MAG: hypothetical protein GXX86_03155 [Propionibacterium sp.]|nr:hypothetical protein [Propionibacterium sp.]
MSSPAPSGRRARWILPVVIVAGLVALLLVGLVGWMFFRPVLPGDYGKVHGESRLLLDRHNNEVMFQVVQLAQTDTADPDANRARVESMMTVVDEYGAAVQGLTGERAFDDPEVAEAYRPVTEAVSSYRDFLADWGDSIPPVKHMQQVCHEFDREHSYMDSSATGEAFDTAAANCLAAVEEARDVEVQDGIVQARADYLEQRRAAWQLNGEARAGGRLDRSKNQQAIRADHEATNAWSAADQQAAADVVTALDTGSGEVVSAWEEFGRMLEARS